MRHYILGAVALAGGITLSSFKGTPETANSESQVTNSYFRFNSAASATEPNLETMTNWTFVNDGTTPAPSPCAGSTKVCISHVLPSAAGINPSDAASVKVQKFRDYLADQDGDPGEQASALAYIAANTDVKQP